MSSAFYIPALNLMGEGALEEAARQIQLQGFKHALIVTDGVLNKIGVAASVQQLLKKYQVDSEVYDGVQPNPTVANVDAGLKILKANNSDCVVSLGGGSSHDCAKGIALLAANGGEIADYEGVDVSAKPQLPLIGINTTAGTASEMTRFCIITDEARHVKMAIVDKNVTPVMSVNDPALMVGMPASLTAATGMDALTHAIEAYVSTAANPITDAVAIKAIELIRDHLRDAVKDGKNMVAREQMAYAQFMAGMAFNNASLGYVHAMAHQLGGFYNLPHGVCNAVLLPHVERYNATVAAPRLKDVAIALGVDVAGLNDQQAAEAAIQAISQMASDVGIPAGLKDLGVKEEDFNILADNALKDACGLTNPKKATHAEIVEIFAAAF
ncbi:MULTISPECIES: L-threonine dehydrogenase [Dickeya]|uniref:Iron-containing alcohol dehydrogenase n=1 Tax=Dickeya zeae (strain Ech586) TaxID=590409 RepID=D2BYL7_DICZ5|nr:MULTISPECIES: L-threonine dehydrogenase [Dickeya]ACZ76685.1 iron-containing alcohol dehydrogenase [Dickeya parazeae Ech586]MBP2836183.1 L-threonine dehydrogenase [Dickeya parazeae]UCZ74990.1 L-threonine dehydrogenase [Dickeya zeae]